MQMSENDAFDLIVPDVEGGKEIAGPPVFFQIRITPLVVGLKGAYIHKNGDFPLGTALRNEGPKIVGDSGRPANIRQMHKN